MAQRDYCRYIKALVSPYSGAIIVGGIDLKHSVFCVQLVARFSVAAWLSSRRRANLIRRSDASFQNVSISG